jgi:CofD-related protein of GAK system
MRRISVLIFSNGKEAAMPEPDRRGGHSGGQRVIVPHTAIVPDEAKLARYLKTPELGPRLLFFSGGSALKRVSKNLIDYTHNSIHIITPFDDGGSSAVIRDAFAMLSIGDLRNRLMALADQTVKGNPEIYRLFSYRLPQEGQPEALKYKLGHIAAGWDSLIDKVSAPMKEIICNHLQSFLEFMPEEFDLRGANIGNLVLTAGYLNNRRNIGAVLFLFSRLVESRGIVKPVLAQDLHLAAELSNGMIIAGQHLITKGEQIHQVGVPIRKLFITSSRESPAAIQPAADSDVIALIGKAELICFPVGSFYTSVMANLLPVGVGKAVAGNICPKVFVPNTLFDSEQFGMSLGEAVETIIGYLAADAPGRGPTDFLNLLIIDSQIRYPFDLEMDRIRALGIDILDVRLATPESYPYVDPRCLCDVLLSLT